MLMTRLAAGGPFTRGRGPPGSTQHTGPAPPPLVGFSASAPPPGELDPVAADGGARPARALGLDRAGRRAAVVRDEVPVVALLVALLDPVAAHGLVADRHRRRPHVHAGPAGLDRARGAAPVAARGVAVVALLVPRDDPVAATGGDAGPAGVRALPAGLHLAGRRAPVAARRVAVVALLVALHLAVTAHRRVHAGLARRGADVPGLDRADRAAPVAAHGVAVVALLVALEDAVAADGRHP